MSDSPLPALWDMDSADYECDCPGPPPPLFQLPPPPRPPFLHELADCSEAPLLDLETCDAMPVSPTFIRGTVGTCKTSNEMWLAHHCRLLQYLC